MGVPTELIAKAKIVRFKHFMERRFQDTGDSSGWVRYYRGLAQCVKHGRIANLSSGAKHYKGYWTETGFLPAWAIGKFRDETRSSDVKIFLTPPTKRKRRNRKKSSGTKRMLPMLVTE